MSMTETMEQAFDHFTAWSGAMRRRGLAAGTVDLRRLELRAWSRFVGPRWREATWHDVEAWLGGRPVEPRTKASAVSHLRAFYRWARREGLVSVDPCADVETPRIPKRLPRPARPAACCAPSGTGPAAWSWRAR